jgi:hypothetical protein
MQFFGISIHDPHTTTRKSLLENSSHMETLCRADCLLYTVRCAVCSTITLHFVVATIWISFMLYPQKYTKRVRFICLAQIRPECMRTVQAYSRSGRTYAGLLHRCMYLLYKCIHGIKKRTGVFEATKLFRMAKI